MLRNLYVEQLNVYLVFHNTQHMYPLLAYCLFFIHLVIQTLNLCPINLIMLDPATNLSAKESYITRFSGFASDSISLCFATPCAVPSFLNMVLLIKFYFVFWQVQTSQKKNLAKALVSSLKNSE